jgi:two-component system, NtrC family, sensor kinase
MPAKGQGRSDHKPQNLEELQSLFQIVSEGKRVWEATFDAIVDPVLIVSPHFVIERANLAAARAVNQGVQELIGKKCYEVFAKRKDPCVGCPMVMGLKSHSPERNRLKPFVDQREYVASAFPIHAKEGGDLGVAVLQYQDLSAIRKLEEQLVQSEKMAAMGLFASGIAHDINNPLSGVLAFAQLAMKDVDPNSQTYADLKEIEASALRCKKIVEDLLLLAKPSTQVERSMVDLGRLVERILPSLKVQWKNAGYSVKLDLPKLTPVSVCESKFEQVFTNILTNAFQALNIGGEISIRCGEDENSIFVEFKDNGRGIPKQHLKSIFDPYFTTKGHRGGTGLGLPICYNIVREHGGRIEVHSTEGKGSIFQIYIPKGGEDETSNTRR